MKTLILSLLLPLSLFAIDFHYLVNKSQLKKEIYKKFPIEKKTLLTNIVLSNPLIELKDSKILFESVVTLPRLLDDKNNPLTTKIKFSSAVTFVSPNKLFLKNIKILDIENDFLENEKKELMLLSLSIALNSYFHNHPVYTIDYDDIKNDMAKMAASYLRKIDIKDEGIDLIFQF